MRAQTQTDRRQTDNQSAVWSFCIWKNLILDMVLLIKDLVLSHTPRTAPLSTYTMGSNRALNNDSNYVAKQSPSSNWLLFYFYPLNENGFCGLVWFFFFERRWVMRRPRPPLTGENMGFPIQRHKIGSGWFSGRGKRQIMQLKQRGNRTQQLRLCLD